LLYIDDPRLKPVDFTLLKDKTKDFLQEFLLQLFIDTQVSTPSIAEGPRSLARKITSRNRDLVEEVFWKISAHEGLRVGLYYFIGHVFKEEVDEDENGFVAWAVGVSKEALGSSL
jgi:nucleolar MIF4G domain-containing protein 1